MNEAASAKLTTWVAEAGLAGLSELEILAGFSDRLAAAGIPISRSLIVVDTLHPIVEGHVFRWRRDGQEIASEAYGRDYDAEAWARSPFFHLSQSQAHSLRRRLTAEAAAEFSFLNEFIATGHTDYVAVIDRFGKGDVFGALDCVYSSWMTAAPDGFKDSEVAAIERLSPLLALAIKSLSLARISRTLVETYLGRATGRRVLDGRIVRGHADRIEAVLWFSDLRGYTRISDTSEPEQIIPFLNDYADSIVTAIHENGGEVLKFIGDGVLAVFPAEPAKPGCESAVAAAKTARLSIADLNARRRADGLPATDMYLGLHLGSAFYGNIGSTDRLDFTVVGPAVNEVSRVAAMARSVDQPVLMSAAFAGTIDPDGKRFVSVGRYALRGVGRPQELYTLDPDVDGL